MAVIPLNNPINNVGSSEPLRGNGAPTAATFAGVAVKGALYLDLQNGTLYQNTGTQAVPAWTAR